jgi:hypothetical protein
MPPIGSASDYDAWKRNPPSRTRARPELEAGAAIPDRVRVLRVTHPRRRARESFAFAQAILVCPCTSEQKIIGAEKIGRLKHSGRRSRVLWNRPLVCGHFGRLITGAWPHVRFFLARCLAAWRIERAFSMFVT